MKATIIFLKVILCATIVATLLVPALDMEEVPTFLSFNEPQNTDQLLTQTNVPGERRRVRRRTRRRVNRRHERRENKMMDYTVNLPTKLVFYWTA